MNMSCQAFATTEAVNIEAPRGAKPGDRGSEQLETKLGRAGSINRASQPPEPRGF